MESRQDESHVSEMTVAGLERKAASLTGSAFVRDTHTAVEGAVGDDGSIMFQIKEFPVRDFDDTLADNIIIGPNGRAEVSGAGLSKNSGRVSPYITPNLSSLITLGTRSMTWALPRSTCAPSGGCMAVVKSSRSWQGSPDDSFAREGGFVASTPRNQRE